MIAYRCWECRRLFIDGSPYTYTKGKPVCKTCDLNEESPVVKPVKNPVSKSSRENEKPTKKAKKKVRRRRIEIM